MNRDTKAWETVLDRCWSDGREVLREAVERVFKKHPRLATFDAYMGTSAFSDINGKIVDEFTRPKLPKAAHEVNVLEGEMCNCVGTYSVTWVNKNGKAVEVQRDF